MEVVLLVADLADRFTGDRDQLFGSNRGGAAGLAREHDAVGRDQGFDPAARLRLGRQIGVDHGIGNAVANLVRVALGHRFTGEYEIALQQETALSERPVRGPGAGWPLSNVGSQPSSPILCRAERYVAWMALRLVRRAVGTGGERLCQIEQAAADDSVINLIVGANKIAQIASTDPVP